MAIADLQSESSVEAVKRASGRLRGNLAAELANDAANVSNESKQILKFHGIYSQDNRDVRRERALAGESLEYIFMIRVVVPGGRSTPDQRFGLDEIAFTQSDGTIRLTTRQAVQFHGVLKGSLGRTRERTGRAVPLLVWCVRRRRAQCGHLPATASRRRRQFWKTSLAIFVKPSIDVGGPLGDIR